MDKRKRLLSELSGLLQIPEPSQKWWFLSLERYSRLAVAPKRHSKLFKEANRHARALTSTLMRMTPEELVLIDQGMDGPIYMKDEDGDGPISFVDALSLLVNSLDRCVGRDPDREPDDQTHEPNWRLNGVLRELHRIISHKDLEMKDHRSKKLARVLGILHELLPDVVPERVPESSIRDVFRPRPRKDVRKP
jgi:hypothetical protein